MIERGTASLPGGVQTACRVGTPFRKRRSGGVDGRQAEGDERRAVDERDATELSDVANAAKPQQAPPASSARTQNLVFPATIRLSKQSIDIDGSEVNRNYDAVRLTGDARLALEDLRRELGRHDLTRRRAQVGAVGAAIASGRDRYAADARPLLTSERSPVRPERVMAELDRLLTTGTLGSL